jgi:excisionase family DNA binding protein
MTTPAKHLDERLAYDAKEAAALVGMSYTLFRQLIREHEIPAFRVGRRWMITRKALERWLEMRSQQRAEIDTAPLPPMPTQRKGVRTG